MAIRPTGIPRWAYSTASGIVQPTDAKQAVGWGATGASGERPPAQYMNWLDNLAGEWLKYLAYETVVEDDFIRQGLPYQQAYGLSGPWALMSGITGGWFTYGNVRFGANVPAGAMGMVEIGSCTGTTHSVVQGVGTPGYRDAVCEAKVLSKGPSGLFQVGLIGEVAFHCTGLSGGWMFQAGSTKIDTGRFYNPSGYQRLAWERIGGTFVAEIDGAQVAVLGATQYLSGPITGSVLGMIGQRGGGGGTNPSGYFEMDRIKFGVRP